MNPYAIIPLICFVSLVAVGCYTYTKNRRSRLSTIFLVLAIFCSYWAFVEFGYRISITAEQAAFWARAGFLRSMAIPLIAHFILSYTQSSIGIRRKFLYGWFYLPGMVFCGFDLAFLGVSGKPSLYYWGWGLGPSPHPLIQYAYISWGILCAIALLIVIIRHHLKEYEDGRREIRVFTTSMVLLLLVGLTALLVDRLTDALPEMTTLIGAAIVVAFAVQVNRLGLFDISPQTAAEDILSIMPDCLILVDQHDRIAMANNATLELFGGTLEDLRNQRLRDVLAVCETHEPIVIGGKVSGGVETRLVTCKAKRIPFLMREAEIRGKNGNYLGRVIVGNDLRERKRVEEELRKTQRLESLEIIAGSIAHDFNNLLTSLSANLSLARIAESGHEKNEKIEVAEKASYAAAQLTQQLLGFSREHKPEIETCLVKDIIEQAVSLSLHGTNVNADVSLAGDLLSIEADRYQLLQVFMNLLINARQAMPYGGNVTISARNVFESKNVDSRFPCVEITIKDEGGGMPQEILAYIYDPFFSRKENGSGLGLAIAQSIVKRHGGSIEVASKVGIGTTFSIVLPASDLSDLADDSDQKPAAKRTGRILVMDDDAMVRKALGELLISMGLEVVFAQDGAEAIETYIRSRAEGKIFNGVILDLTVSKGRGGKETIGRLREIDPSVRAVITSGYSHDDVVVNHQEHGFVAAIPKPFSRDKLAGVIETLLREKAEAAHD